MSSGYFLPIERSSAVIPTCSNAIPTLPSGSCTRPTHYDFSIAQNSNSPSADTRDLLDGFTHWEGLVAS